MALFKKIIAYILGILALGFVILVIVRAFHFYNLDKTNAQIEIIHNTKLRMVDVMGENLPPDPGVAADATIAGVDANHNGIRDDVELAVFKEYPKSAKTRAVLLQYALALQMEFIQPIINKETVTEVIREIDRAHACIGDALVPRFSPESSRTSVQMQKIDFYISSLDKKQVNTLERTQYEANFYDKLGSYNPLDPICDIDYSTLPN